MNTQLEDRSNTDTLPEAHFSRPQPVWTDKLADEAPTPSPRRSRRWIVILVTVVVAATAALVVWAIINVSSTTIQPTQRPAFDSPGGNSLSKQ